MYRFASMMRAYVQQWGRKGGGASEAMWRPERWSRLHNVDHILVRRPLVHHGSLGPRPAPRQKQGQHGQAGGRQHGCRQRHALQRPKAEPVVATAAAGTAIA